MSKIYRENKQNLKEMPFKRKISCRSKVQSEHKELPVSTQCEPCKYNNKDLGDEQLTESVTATIVPEYPIAGSKCTLGELAKNVDNLNDNNAKSEEIIGDNSDSNDALNVQTDKLVNSEDCAQCEYVVSLPIPDGLAMDPLSPTALAVPTDLMDRIGSGLSILRDHGKKVQKYLWKGRKLEVLKKTWKSMVTIVLVEARDLPDGPANNSNGLYCKFRLGNETYKSKQVHKAKPVWRERFNLHFYDDSKLEIKVWHKVKQKNFMGRCLIDLSQFERERTHDLWQELECGYGSLHLLVTLCGADRSATMENVLSTNEVRHPVPADDKFLWYRLDDSWSEVGQLSVTVHGARGLSALNLSGNVDAYCILELDNSRVQTHVVQCASEPNWNKSFVFAVNDVTSTLDITVYDESIIQAMKCETLGKISIPLLRINNNEKKWYALKDRSQKSSAKGNCPRILMEMSLVWNPVKASLRILSPKETKYVQKPPKFNIPLIYSNLKFIKNVFNYIQVGNEHFKRVFEWENQEKSAVALGAWLIFWYFFRMWMTPLLLILPFAHNWFVQRNNNIPAPVCQYDEDPTDDDLESHKDDKTLKTRLFGLQDLTLTIKNAIDYIVSFLERINNLFNFSVPYLSYLTIIALVAASIALYIIPINYIFMAFGIYKFTRKFLNPQRLPNNDLLDFISRVPDNKILKQWQELKVPEPNAHKTESIKGR